MSVTERLRRNADSIWVSILNHPFVIELYTGKLPLAKFRSHSLQDYNFLIGLVRSLSFLAAKAPRLELSKMALELAYRTVTREMRNYGSLLRRLRLSISDAERETPNPTNLAYVNFLISTSSLQDFWKGLAALLPCFWSYQEIAFKHRAKLESNRVNLYRKWASVYLTGDYTALVSRLRSAIDRSGTDFRALKYHFLLASKYEFEFWDSSYREEV